METGQIGWTIHLLDSIANRYFGKPQLEIPLPPRGCKPKPPNMLCTSIFGGLGLHPHFEMRLPW